MGRRLPKVASFLVAGALVIGGAGAVVAAAPTPVTIDCTQPTGLVLDTPGEYRLTADAIDCTSLVAVSITASDVSFDLGGHLIKGKDAAKGIVAEPGTKKVKVFDGSIDNYGVAVDFEGTKKSLITRVAASSSGECIALGSNNKAKQSAATGCELGIGADDNSVIHDNVVKNSFRAIGVDDNNKITDNALSRSDEGLNHGDGNLVAGNSINLTKGYGISGNSHNEILDNVVSNIEDFGIDVGDDNFIADNKVASVGEIGINAFENNKVASNVVSGTGDDGISLQDGNQVKKNIVSGSGDDGLAVRSSNSVSLNRISASESKGIIVAGGSNVIEANRIKHNKDDGIAFTSPVPVSKTKVLDNKTKGNGDDMTVAHGIDISSVDASSKVIVKGNVADSNTGQGINVGGTTAPVGEKANEAQANQITPQCDFDLCR